MISFVTILFSSHILGSAEAYAWIVPGLTRQVGARLLPVQLTYTPRLHQTSSHLFEYTSRVRPKGDVRTDLEPGTRRNIE